MCVLDQQTKVMGYTQDILAFLNESATLFIQHVYQTPSYTVIKYHTLQIV